MDGTTRDRRKTTLMTAIRHSRSDTQMNIDDVHLPQGRKKRNTNVFISRLGEGEREKMPHPIDYHLNVVRRFEI